MKRKYGLLTAIAMVVGIVIGSGVFFKADKVLINTNGNLSLGIFAWIIGGVVMIISSYVFASLSSKYEKSNGLVDYFDVSFGKRAAYFIGWYLSIIYLTSLVAVLAWVSGRYTAVLFNINDSVSSWTTFAIGLFYMLAIYCLNLFAPYIAGKFQISTTIIKLIPLFAVAIIGLIYGLANGVTVENFTANKESDSEGFFKAVVATVFAYEGWIIATTINSEIKNAKRNLPIALFIGTLIIAATYLLYYIGLAGTLPNEEFINNGENAVKRAFSLLFTPAGGTILIIIVVISCLGTLNGLVLGAIRSLYSIAIRGSGPKPETFVKINKKSNVPVNSGIVALMLSLIWYIVWILNFKLKNSFFGHFIDISELPIVVLYIFYIPLYIWMIIKHKSDNIFNRIIMPILAIIAAVFMIICTIYSFKLTLIVFLIIVLVIMLIAIPFMPKKLEIASEN